MLVQSSNLLDKTAPFTYLTNPEVNGTNVLRWKNPNGFAASYAMQVGKTGAQQSEVVLLGTAAVTTGTAGTLTANTLYEHPTDTPLFAIKFDQVVFERSTTGTAGVATIVATVTYQPNAQYTVYDDTTGSNSYAYKTFYRNSVTAGTTIESDWIIPTTSLAQTNVSYPFSGNSFHSLGKLRQRAKDKLYDANYIPTDQMWNDWANEWLGAMNNVMVDVNEDYGIGTIGLSFNAGQELGTFTNTDFKGMIKRVWSVTSTGTFQATKMDSASYIPTKTFVDSYPYYYMQGDSVIGRFPNDAMGTLLIEYPKTATQMINDTDEIPVPMHGHTRSFVNYMLAQARGKDNKPEEAQRLESLAESQKESFKNQITPRLRSGATYVDIVEDTGAQQDVWL